MEPCTWEELKEHVRILNQMLQDPHPGLMSWCEIFAEHLKGVSDYWTNQSRP